MSISLIVLANLLFIECFRQPIPIIRSLRSSSTVFMGKGSNRMQQNVDNFEQAISVAVITPASSIVPAELNILTNIYDKPPQLLSADEFALFARETEHRIAIPFVTEDCLCMYFDNEAKRDEALEKLQEFLTFYREQSNNEARGRKAVYRRRDPNDTLLFTKFNPENNHCHMLRVPLLGFIAPQYQSSSVEDGVINAENEENQVDDLDIMQGTRSDLS